MKKQKINWSWMAFPITGIIIGAVGTSAYFIVNDLIHKDAEVFKRSEGKTTWFNFDGKKAKKDNTKDRAFQFKVVDNINTSEDDISEEVLGMVAQKFMKRGIFGPELGSLKTISFNDPNIISKEEANGVYIPSTKEIGINTTNISNLIDSNLIHSGSINSNLNDNISSIINIINILNLNRKEDFINEVKSEAIFQILYHEYGHHIAESYAQSPYTGPVTEIYNRNEVNKENKILSEKWNKKFMDEFMKIFSYDDQNSLPLELNIKKSFINNDESIEPIGKKFSSYSLFKNVNLTNSKPSEEEWKRNYINYSSRLLTEKNTPLRSMKEYSYYYSAEELFTRKLLLASATFSKEAQEASQRIKFWVYDLLVDFMNTNTPIPLKGFLPNLEKLPTPYSLKYMNDFVFQSPQETPEGFITGWERSDKYLKAIDDLMGHKNNNNISYLWNKNNAFVVGDNKIINYNSETKEKSNPNEIKFGGYVDSNKYEYIGYFKDNKYIPISSIKTLPFKIGYKKYLLSSKREDIKYYKLEKTKTDSKFVEDKELGKLKYTYYLDSWINPEEIQNKKLYFSKTKEGKIKSLLRKGRTKEQGLATTFSKWAKYDLNESNGTIWSARSIKEINNKNGTKNIQVFDNNSGDYITIYKEGKYEDSVSINNE